MNIANQFLSRTLIATAVTAALLAGCASAPEKPAGSAEVRAKLTALQGDAALATQAPVATKDAEAAVKEAEIIHRGSQGGHGHRPGPDPRSRGLSDQAQ
jgi:hypothetical protein